MGKILSLIGKIELLKKYLEKLEEFKQYSKEELIAEGMLRDSFELKMLRVTETVLQLCDIVGSFENQPKTSYADSLKNTLKLLQIPEDLYNDFVSIAGFRNRLVHEYEDINYEVLYEILQTKIDQIRTFIHILELYIQR